MTMDAYATQIVTNLTRLIDDRVREALAQHTPQPVPQWLDTKGAASYLACKTRRIYGLVQLGHLQPYRDGRALRFTTDQLDQYLRRGR